MSVDHEDSVLRFASDPTTPGSVLTSCLALFDGMPSAPSREVAAYRASVRSALLRNPNLPTDLLREAMGDGEVDAWLNPAVPLLLLENPMPDEERLDGLWKALCNMANIQSYGLAVYMFGGKIDAQHLRYCPGWDDLRARYTDDIRHLVRDPL